jgi:hypothetical protein
MIGKNARRGALVLALSVLNGCAFAPPIRTPSPTAPADAGAATQQQAPPTPAPIRMTAAAGPQATAPAAAPVPAATPAITASALPTAPAIAASATALAAAQPPDRQPPLATFFFYWYNCPTAECDASRLLAVPDGWQSPLDYDPDGRDGLWYSSFNYDWFEMELRTIASTGITIVLPVSWGDHPHPWFRPDRIDVLVQANSVLERPLQIGLFLDTTAQQGLYAFERSGSYSYGDGAALLPLSDPLSGWYFYERHIRGYFRRVPREMWATVNGRPLIVTYSAGCCADLQLSGELWAAVKRAFAADFGVEPWLILETSWTSADAQAGAGLPRAVDVADGLYRWGSALHGLQSDELRGYRVSSVGPGFDNSGVVGPAAARIQPRDTAPDGSRGTAAFLRAGLAAIPPDSDLVLIETWNEWPENSAVAPAAYRDAAGNPADAELYLDVIRAWRRSLP